MEIISKKQLKKIKAKQNLLYEIVLLLPSFSYMYEQQISAKEKSEDTKEEQKFILLTQQLTKKMAVVLKNYSKIQEEAVSVINEILIKLDSKGNNVFMIGLNLLLIHKELQNKKIHIGMTKHITDLEDSMLDQIQDYDYADKVRAKTEEFCELAKKKIFISESES